MTHEEFATNIITRIAFSLDHVAVEQLRAIILNELSGKEIVEQETLPATDPIDNEKLIRRFLATKNIEGCSKGTLSAYSFGLRKFSDFLNGFDLKDVTTDMIRIYLGNIASKNQNSYADTVRRYLNTFYQWAENEDIILKNPCRKIKHIKCEKKMEKPFSGTDIAMLQDCCYTHQEKAIVSILLSTGIRRAETVAIKISDIDFQTNTILIHGKGSKQRFVYFSDNCKLHLKKHLDSRPYESPYLFASSRFPYGPLSVESIHTQIKNIGKASGVTNVHCHRFRKWFGTSMADKGVDIRDLQEMMGHSKMDTTNKYYIYSNEKRVRSEHLRFSI